MDWKKLKLGLLFIGVFSALIAFAHPFYVSITSVDYNPSKKRVEVSCRLFYDDLEVALKNQLGQHIDVIHPKKQGGSRFCYIKVYPSKLQDQCQQSTA